MLSISHAILAELLAPSFLRFYRLTPHEVVIETVFAELVYFRKEAIEISFTFVDYIPLTSSLPSSNIILRISVFLNNKLIQLLVILRGKLTELVSKI